MEIELAYFYNGYFTQRDHQSAQFSQTYFERRHKMSSFAA